MEKFKDSISTGNVEIVIGYSTDVVSSFQDDYFDWIYIDTDHSYSNTISELSLYGPKMKKDGIICGHDFIQGNFTGLLKYGVIEAVREFCLKENWEILYLTFDFNDNPSYAIRKLN
jgi:predicted O-methyltransferase YrrM